VIEVASDVAQLAQLREPFFQEDDLGGVRFVPLIGTQGWPE